MKSLWKGAFVVWVTALALGGCSTFLQNPAECTLACVESCRFCCDPTYNFGRDEPGPAPAELSVAIAGGARAMAF